MSANVSTPETSRASGIAARRGENASARPRPTTAAAITGSLTIDVKNSGTAAGSSESVRWRPRSSAEVLV